LKTDMSGNYKENNFATAGKLLAVLTILFGVLFFASSSNELLKQAVLTADFSVLQQEADCRADELEEEGLSLRECELMLVQVEIFLASSPNWFRSVQQTFSVIGIAASLASIGLALSLDSRRGFPIRALVWVLSGLVVLDSGMFVVALQTGPLLRAQYLWPLILWFFIHLCLVLGGHFISANTKDKLIN
jgi:hypothetical protein